MMKSVRRIHGWLGVLFAPSILLFTLSGMFQISGCHEAEDGHQPNSLIVRMAMIHMHQQIELPRRRPRPEPPKVADGQTGSGAAAPAASRPPQGREEPPFHPVKLFFLAMCVALIASSILGVWIAFASKRDQKLHVGLFVAGIAIPIVLLLV